MWKKIVFGIGFLLILQHILTLVYIMGFHKRVYDHRPGPCRIIPGIEEGAEDIALLSNGLAFITSGLNPMHMGLKLDPVILAHTGRMFLFDFNHPDQNVTELKFTGKDFDIKRFSPHGISAYEDTKSGAVSVFVVNHRRDAEVIEIFQFDQNTLTLNHKKSVTNTNYMKSVNDVVAISENTFYFTNDGYSTTFWMRTIEDWFMLARGNVVYYDGRAMKKVVDRGFGCNGINVSPDNKYIYVVQPVSMIINVYERLKDSTLKHVKIIDIGSFGDNIFIEPDSGDLWIAGHPIGHKLLEHFQSKSTIAPSQVLYIDWDDDEAPYKYALREAFTDSGDFLSGSTIAIHHEGGLLIGSVVTKLAYCQVKAF